MKVKEQEMNNMVDIKYSKAFSEVLEVLKYIPKEEYEKIPLDIIGLMEDNCLKDYKVEYNPGMTLSEQNFLEETKYIIAIFFRDYWATDIQKNKILLKEQQDAYLENLEKEKKFNTDIFENKLKNVEIENKQKENNQLAIIEKDNIFKRIITKIKSYFKKKI